MKKENKKILYDVKCSKALVEEIEKLGGEAIISRTGNSYTKSNTKDNDCIFGGEFSGHVYFRDKFLGIDSEVVCGARGTEIHAYNFVYPNGYGNEPIVLYDPSHFVNFIKNDNKV